jgi:hypothetical protein
MRLLLALSISIAATGLIADAYQTAPAAAPAPVVEWLKAHRTEGTALPADLLTPSKDPARFALIGRAFEGAHELGRFEKDVWKSASGFDVVAVDVGFAEGEAADAWIRTGKGDPTAIAQSFGAWGWDTAVARAFLEALHTASKKPTFVGIGVGEPGPLLPALLDFVRKAYPEGLPRAERVLDGLRLPGRNGRPRYWFLDDNERGVMRFGIDEQYSVFNDARELLVSRSSEAEFTRAMRLVKAFAQYEETMRFEREGGDEDPRGRILTENAMEASMQGGKPQCVLAFVNVRDLGRAGDATTFAAQLAKASGTKPVCVATACGAGSFLAFDPNDTGEGVRAPRKVELPADARTTLESALEGCGKDEAVFDLRSLAKDAEAAAWFAQRRNLRSSRTTCGGANETPWDYAVAADFDALVWFPKVSAAALSATSSR